MATWRWNLAALLLMAAVGASVAAVQTEVSAGGGRLPAARTARPSHTAPTPAPRPPGRKLVVLDPGHGGSNTGGRSAVSGVYEKHLTLLLARAVSERLASRGVEVRLTREIDEYLSLRERVERANQLRADLFISIHTNASNAHSQRGFETWILTPQALDIDARALRTSAAPAWYPGADMETALMLDDVERGLSQDGSASLAAAINSELAGRRGRERDRGVRQSSMDVLLGASMPAALVEVGFIDHPIEGQELLEPEVQATIADALAAGIAARL
jgi:N-acetylmuramoyl-L-alanine amidase